MGCCAGNDAVVILRVFLHLFEALLAARGATEPVRKVLFASIVRLCSVRRGQHAAVIMVAGLKTHGEDLFRVDRRKVDGAVAKVDLAFRVADSERPIARSAGVWMEEVSTLASQAEGVA